jgi:hypothetical protein
MLLLLMSVLQGKPSGAGLTGEPGGLVQVLKLTSRSLFSSAYIIHASASYLTLLKQAVVVAFSLALASAGKSSAARIAIMAITTSNSINVKPRCQV